MAKMTPGAIVSEISGKVASTYFQRSRTGQRVCRRPAAKGHLSERSRTALQQMATLRQRWKTLTESRRQAMRNEYGSNLRAFQVYSTIGSVAMYAGIWSTSFDPHKVRMIETVTITQADDTRIRLQLTQVDGAANAIYSALFITDGIPPSQQIGNVKRYRFAGAGSLALIDQIDFDGWSHIAWDKSYDASKNYRGHVYFFRGIDNGWEGPYTFDLP